jgi:ABC-type transporter Mla subunit MlaD
MTDPITPDHDQPVEGSRSDSYTDPDAGNLGSSTNGASDATNGAGAKATDMIESLREAVEEFAEKASPVVRQYSARAAEVVATVADKAAPLAHKVGDATADASEKLAVKSRTWAAEVRESLPGSGTDTPTDRTEPPTTI